MRPKLVLSLAVILGSALVLIWWWNPCVSPQITVINAAASPIAQVVIEGSGLEESLDELDPGRSIPRSVQSVAVADDLAC